MAKNNFLTPMDGVLRWAISALFYVSSMKYINNPLPWCPRDTWCWPDKDKKLIQVLEHVADIDYIMQFVGDPRVCVQAGGACGVWPYRFSQFFDRVYTFEPQPDNYECLLENLSGCYRVIPQHAPLSDDVQTYSIKNDSHELENFGAGYAVADPKGLQSVTIDSLKLDCCDLIQLDIEGFELRALMGGMDTIEAFSPVIVLEEKPLNHVVGDHAKPRKWLEQEFGYRIVGTIHKDVVLARD